MIIKNNEDLKKYSAIRVGGIAKKILFPESLDDLIEAYREESTHIIANGTNVLINDREFDCVVNLSKMPIEMTQHGDDGRFSFSTAVKTLQMINFINSRGFGGPEFLCCVPGTVGGAIYMNAGRGADKGQFISNYIESVKIFDGEGTRVLSKDECKFSFRESIFHHKKWIILSADFIFPAMSEEETSKRKMERKEYCKINQDHSGGNLGSTFCLADGRILTFARKMGLGSKNGVHFSKKTSNWLLNSGNGTYDEAINAIKKVEKIHRLFGKKTKREIIIWE